MQNFEGKVAVVTGAASGIGLALAERYAREGMKVVMADIEATALGKAATSIGGDVLPVLTDVSNPESVDALAQAALDRFGKVHIVCNNAGVLGGRPGAIWEATLNDWRWILGVNVWGVIHGLRTFTPILLRQAEEGWIVNTASMGGLVPGGSPYGVSEHAVVAISEALYSHLKLRSANVGCSVLCPIFIRTGILNAVRNRPPELQDIDLRPPNVPTGRFATRIEHGQPPSDMADAVIEGIRNQQFYIWPGDEVDAVVRERFEHILNRTNPNPRPFG